MTSPAPLLDQVQTIPRHPAKYNPALYPNFAEYLRGCTRIVDPFGGVGGIFDLLAWMPAAQFEAVEIEPDWTVADPRITLGNALHLPWPDAYFDGACTSPTYANRMADHHNARDGSRRNTYTHSIGHELQPDNSGKLHWGEAYRQFHIKAWTELRRVLRPGGVFVLNHKDHIRRGKVQPVTQWHLQTLEALGFTVTHHSQVECPGNRFGANGGRRVDFENVYRLEVTA